MLLAGDLQLFYSSRRLVHPFPPKRIFLSILLIMQELSKLIVTPVREGKLMISSNRTRQVVRIAEDLQAEL